MNNNQRIEELEAQVKQGSRDMNVMSQAMAEIYAWVEATEGNGVQPGTLKQAHNVVRMGHLKTEANTLRLTLEKMGKGATLPGLRTTLQARVAEIEEQIEALGGSSDPS